MKRKRLMALVLAVIVSFTGSGNVSAAGLPGTEQTVESTGETSEELTEGDYTYTVSDGCAAITAYNGAEENVVTPTMLGGYPVTEIGANSFREKEMKTVIISEGVVRVSAQAFMDCKMLKEIRFPSSMQVLGIGGVANDTSLTNIEVAEKSPYFFSEDGVLFKYLEQGVGLDTYPPGKEDIEYVVPRFVNTVMLGSFSANAYLEKLYIPSTVQRIANHSFCRGINALDVYVNHLIEPEFTAEMFLQMPSGSHLIVKNQQMADIFGTKSIFEETPDSSIIVLGTDGYPAIPTTSLTWEGTQTHMSHMLSPGEKCQLTYVQEPFNSTDNITWSSSNEKIARVNAVTGLVEASGCENYSLKTGTCMITGTDESGHSISLDLTVYESVEEVELGFKELSNPESYEVVLEEYSNTQWIGLYCTPVWANNAGNVTWESSNPKIATVQVDEDERENALLTYLAPGTTTITAALNDNGTIWTKLFVLTITKDISDCTVAAIPDQTYTGSALNPAVTVKDESKTLVNGTDYTVTYSDNKAAGMATAVIAGKGLYSGTVTTYFNIVKTGGSGSSENGEKDNTGTGNGSGQGDTKPALKSQSITGISSSYKKAYGTKPFTLKAKAKGKVTYTSSNSRVASVHKTNGKVSIKGTGTCTITVTAAATKIYKKAVKKITISVSPKKAAVIYARSLKKSQMTVKWKKDTKATGYQIQYSTSRKFTKKTTKSITVKKNRTTSQTIKRLKAGKKYYVRVRGYKTVKVNGKSKNLYGNWSTRKQVK